jgi:hypothetical protein
MARSIAGVSSDTTIGTAGKIFQGPTGADHHSCVGRGAYDIGSAGQTQCGGSGGDGAKGRSLHHRTASAPAQSSVDGPLEHATIDLTDDEHVAVTAAIKLAIEATPAPNVKLSARIVNSRRIGEPFDPLAPRALGSRRRSKRSRTPHVAPSDMDRLRRPPGRRSESGSAPDFRSFD